MHEEIPGIFIRTNYLWNLPKNIKITVFTPIYNRRKLLNRVINSVESQTLREIEYILIDDGSIEQIDDIVDKYLSVASIPVMYIKKANGGVHTARNLGWRNARGILSLCIDSDDELLPDACEVFWSTWIFIPERERNKYWQIKAQCINDNGELCDALFPNNINELPLMERYKYFSYATGERIGCRVSAIMKENLFPEPDGVRCVFENIVWAPLERKYLSWGINNVVRIWHQDATERQTIVNKIRIQQCKNILYACVIYLTNPAMYISNTVLYIKTLCKYLILRNILIWIGEGDFINSYKIHKKPLVMLWSAIFFIPCLVLTPIIRYKRCDF